MRISEWTVAYTPEEKPHVVSVPHAWRQETSVSWEGPAHYETEVDVPVGNPWLIFHGVSYAAIVSLDGDLAHEHKGIWDAFSVDLRRFRGKKVRVQVEVVKNGGATYPVRDVASGFLPYVFHTFGGIYQPVELVDSLEDPLAETPPAPPTRVRVEDHRVFVDEEPFYMRGALTWGWYPEVGHTNPPDDTIRAEVRKAKALGFNLLKFCLWVPSHRYLEILKEEGMEAWLELPLWDPTDDQNLQTGIAHEIERIVRQYRRHDNIICWTVGCELSTATGPDYRRYLTQMVRNLTGCPLVKDNSGGAEMYGGDLREFGDFYDFHPYCDTPFYPLVLDSLLPAARKRMPILLGEFNDIDVHRDVSRLLDETPFWASSLSELNEAGVRWQHDLPRFLRTNRFAQEPGLNGHEELVESSRQKALWMRKSVHEWVRARDPISGYVVTGWRDTPISTAGFVDDWGRERFSTRETGSWNAPAVLFLIPTRRPPWVHGGNRPGFLHSTSHFVGPVYWRVGIHSEKEIPGGLVWSVADAKGDVVARGAEESLTVRSLESTEVAQIHWDCPEAGVYRLEVEFGGVRNGWEIVVVPTPNWADFSAWGCFDPAGKLETAKLTGGPNQIYTRLPSEGLILGEEAQLIFTEEEGTLARPFFRETAFQFSDPEFWSDLGLDGDWGRWYPIATDRALDPVWLREQGLEEAEVLMTRIDVRTYEELPMLVRQGNTVATTLRPWGGLGAQPTSLMRNAIGSHFLASLMRLTGS